jgi:glycosyltransferase involved in cell wall biosynthesis
MAETSVIVSNYNYEKYIGEAIDSCIRMFPPPSEIIVVDDKSTDKSLSIIKSFQDQVKYIVLFKNSGSREIPLNIGINMARGEFIVTLDADDTLAPDYFEHVLPKFSNDKIGVVRVAYQRFGEENELQIPRAWTSHDRIKDMLEANHVLGSSCFRKKVWESLRGYTENEYTKVALGDWDFWIRAAIYGWEFADATDKPLCNYRVHGDAGSFTRNFMTPINYLKDKFADLIKEKGVVGGPLSDNWRG